MGLVTYNLPPATCYTRNAIRYKMGTDIDVQTPGLFVECLVEFKAIEAASYTQVIAFPLSPDGLGMVEIDLGRIAHRLVSFAPPKLSGIQKASGQTGMLRATFTEYSLADPDGGTSVETLPVTIVKGGLSHERYQNNVYWDNYFTTKKVLSWQPAARTILPWVNDWLSIMYAGATLANAKAVITIMYTDGSTHQEEYAFPEGGTAKQNLIYHIPSGYANLNLGALDPLKKVHYYLLRAYISSTPISEEIRYNMQYDADYQTFHFNFFNSLGGLDSIAITGDHTLQASRDYDLVDVNTSRSNANGLLVPPMSQMNRTIEQLTYKSNIGVTHSWQLQDLRRELFLSEKIITRKNNRWWPVNVLDKTVDLGSLSAQVKEIPIEWAYAFSNSQYTPDSIDLGNPPNFSISTACLLVTYELTNSSIQVSITHLPTPVDEYLIELLEASTVIDSATKNIPFTSPITHTFAGLDAETEYQVRITMRNTETGEARICEYAPVSTTDSEEPETPTVFAHTVNLAESEAMVCGATPQTVYSSSSVLGSEATIFTDIALTLPVAYMNFIKVQDRIIFFLVGNLIGDPTGDRC